VLATPMLELVLIEDDENPLSVLDNDKSDKVIRDAELGAAESVINDDTAEFGAAESVEKLV